MADKKDIKKKKADDNDDSYSSFWFDEKSFGVDTSKLLKLNAFKRSCSNFVQILTGKNIPVEYSDGDHSYTDGTTVVLSAKVENNFDSTVGLALHEASHILLTEFDFIRKLVSDIKFRRQYVTPEMITRIISVDAETIEKYTYETTLGDGVYFSIDRTLNLLESKADAYLTFLFKDLVNWVEDRRIDNYVYSTAPGYRGYYESLYNRYFLSKEVSDAVSGNTLYNTETLDSYMFRIINLMNPNSDMNALKGLRQIKSIVDLPQISRLKNTTDVAKVSSEMLSVVLNNIDGLNYIAEKLKQFKASDLESLNGKQIKEVFGVPKEVFKRLIKRINEQRKFVDGKVNKKKLTKAELKELMLIKDGGVSIEPAGGEEFNGLKVDVIFIEKLTDAILRNSNYSNCFNMSRYNKMSEQVNRGFVLGRMLGRKLQIRNEERNLVNTRQESGKIDKRLIAHLGHDYENVFHTITTDKFNKSYIHISIDASGSMHGSRIENSVKMSVAIAVACTMTTNLHCAISFRTTNANGTATVIMAYDSRKDKLGHLRKYFSHIDAGGSTPESLCYDVLMKKSFPKIQSNEKFYFINLSDGEPCFGTYTNDKQYFRYDGDSAERHCKRMVNEMVRGFDATILGYFISEREYGFNTFQRMYGSNNSFNIDTDSIEQIARTMNKKFLEKAGIKQ